MRRSPRYAFALALLSVLSLTLLSPSSPSSAQKGPVTDPACVNACTQLLYNCFAANGTGEHRCISVYRSCMGHCK
ncbi:MAG TPA: hypothetical protein VKB12_18310 [Pyrinomonadaceae bacterium]|nr:hypothetical protein [Pyrinomonadaceae bacterium]